MKIRYTQGPPKLIMGAAGEFLINEFREVPDDLAKAILAKKNYPWEQAAAEPASRKKPAAEKE
jgi:hypothetical protein